MADDSVVTKKGERLLKCLLEGVEVGLTEREKKDPLLLSIFVAWKNKVLSLIERHQIEYAKGNCSDDMDLNIPGELLALMDDDGDATEAIRMREIVERETCMAFGSLDQTGSTLLVPFNDLNLQCRENTLTSINDSDEVDHEIRLDWFPTEP